MPSFAPCSRWLLFVPALVLLLSGCKKDDDEKVIPDDCITNDCSHLAGNFLGDFTYQFKTSRSFTRDEGDRVQAITVEGDSLIVLGEKIPITSTGQTHFTKEYQHAHRLSLEVTYSDGFDAVSVEYSYLSANRSETSESFSGARTTLKESVTPHAYAGDLEGNYQLSVALDELSSGVDTNYTATWLVAQQASILKVGDEQSSVRPFHSRLSNHSTSNHDSGSKTTYNTEVFWAGDSLFYHSEYRSDLPNGGQNYRHFTAQGRRQ